MHRNDNFINFAGILRYIPTAVAMVQGGELFPDINGTVRFYDTAYGTVVFAEMIGLPLTENNNEGTVFGFHIHSGESCDGNGFPDTGAHYDKGDNRHPYHTGDLPPLFGSGGIAFCAFLTDRFTAEDVVGKTVVIHDSSDDFKSQPSGNSGLKIACGEIVSVRK